METSAVEAFETLGWEPLAVIGVGIILSAIAINQIAGVPYWVMGAFFVGRMSLIVAFVAGAIVVIIGFVTALIFLFAPTNEAIEVLGELVLTAVAAGVVAVIASAIGQACQALLTTSADFQTACPSDVAVESESQ